MRVGVFHKGTRAMNITLTPIGYVRTTRVDPVDDNWDVETTRIELDTTRFTADALLSLDSFSHVEVIYWFHHAEAATPTLGARHPRAEERRNKRRIAERLVELRGELHRSLDVGKQHADLLAFALQRGARLQDALAQVARGVVAERSRVVAGGLQRLRGLRLRDRR